MGKFVIRRVNSGIKFDLRAANGHTILTSEVYTTEKACLNGIESVRKNAVDAKLEDQTVENFETVTNPKFEVYVDKAGEFRFRLKATNGQVIAVSEGYKAIASCLNGIESVKKNALAHVEDQTVEGYETVTHPKYELYEDKGGEYRWRLKARNGEPIGKSEGYKAKASAVNGIESVGKNAPDAEVVEE